MSRKILQTLIAMLCLSFFSACSQNTTITVQSSAKQTEEENVVQSGAIPVELAAIPNEYKTAAEHAGTLEALEYTTWESATYAAQSKQLTKTAIVYIQHLSSFWQWFVHWISSYHLKRFFCHNPFFLQSPY